MVNMKIIKSTQYDLYLGQAKFIIVIFSCRKFAFFAKAITYIEILVKD